MPGRRGTGASEGPTVRAWHLAALLCPCCRGGPRSRARSGPLLSSFFGDETSVGGSGVHGVDNSLSPAQLPRACSSCGLPNLPCTLCHLFLETPSRSEGGRRASSYTPSPACSVQGIPWTSGLSQVAPAFLRAVLPWGSLGGLSCQQTLCNHLSLSEKFQ